MKFMYVEGNYIVNLSLATHIEIRHGSGLKVDHHTRIEKNSGLPAPFNVVAVFNDKIIVIAECDTEEDALEILEYIFHQHC